MISNFSPKKIYHIHQKLIFIFLLFAIDQISKFIVQSTVPLNSILFSIFGFGITYKINKGFALHVFEQYEPTIIISIIIKILLVPAGILAFRYYQANLRSSRLLTISFVLIMAGLFGNLCDQMLFGYVRDFILWPGPGTPNLADLFAETGLVCLLVELLSNRQIDKNWRVDHKSLKQSYAGLQKFLLFSKNEIRAFVKRK